MNNYISKEEIIQRLETLKNHYNCGIIVTEAKGVSGCWYISLDPIDLGWYEDTGYIADFKEQYGYEPDDSNMYWDYDTGLEHDLRERINELFKSKYFTISEWEVSTEYKYVEFTLEQSYEELEETPNNIDLKLYPNINVYAICEGKQYFKIIEKRDNMVGEDIRDLLIKTFKPFLHKADIYFCCTLNDSNYLGYHKADGSELEKCDVFNLMDKYSNWEEILKQVENELPGITELYVDPTSDDFVYRISLKFESKDDYALGGKFAKSTNDEISKILNNSPIRCTMSIMDNFKTGLQYMVIKPYPKIEKFLKF